MVRLTPVLISGETEGAPPASITALQLARKDLHELAGLDVFERLVRLDLSDNRLHNLQGLSTCKCLKWLSVSGNGLTSLRGVEGLSKLTVLNGSRNQITSMDEVGGLVELRALILNDNQISSICRLDRLSALNTLVLSRNPIRNLGKALSKASSLTKLSLSNCQLEEVGGCLKRCVALKELRLAHNQLACLPKELEQNDQLYILDVGNNHLQSWSDLEVLGMLHTLENLNLRGNPVCYQDNYEAEVKGLRHSLQVLDGHLLQSISKKQGKKWNSKGRIGLKAEADEEKPEDFATDTTEVIKTKKVKRLKSEMNAEAEDKQPWINENSKRKVDKDKELAVNDETKPFLELIASMEDQKDTFEQTKKHRFKSEHRRPANSKELDSGVVSIKVGKKSKFTRLNTRKPKNVGSPLLHYLEEVNIGTGGPSSWDA